MREFKLEEWLEDKTQKVVTRNGQSVRIICTDGPNSTYPVVGFVTGVAQPLMWSRNGKIDILDNRINDIFFMGKELTKFQQELVRLFYTYDFSTFQNRRNIAIQYSPILLKLAKKELALKEIMENYEEIQDKFIKIAERELAVNTQDDQSKGGCSDYGVVKENITRKVIKKAANWISLNAELYGGFNQGKLNEMVKNLEKELVESMITEIQKDLKK